MGGDIISLASLTAYLGGEGYNVSLEELIARPTMGEQIALLSLRMTSPEPLDASSSSTLTSALDRDGRVKTTSQQQQSGEQPIGKRVSGRLWSKSAVLAMKMRIRRTRQVARV